VRSETTKPDRLAAGDERTRWRRLLPDRLEWRAAWRSARRQPLASATIVVALAAGIAMATVGFAFFQAVFWGELPFPDGDRFVRLRAFTPAGERTEIELDRYRFLRDNAGSMDYLGALAAGRYDLIDASGNVQSVSGAELTPGWFGVVSYAPVAGRLLVDADGRPGAPPVVVVRESFWRRELGGDPRAVGRTLEIEGVERTIVGLAPDSFEFPGSGELWLATSELEPRSAGGVGLRFAGVLAAGVAIETAARELDRLAAQFDAAHPVAEPPRIVLGRITDLSGSGLGAAIALTVAVLLLVLLLVASNVANLVVARTAARSSELALRSALGASRGTLVRQISLEVLTLGALAAVVGLAGAQGFLAWLESSLAEDDLPFWFDFAPSAGRALFVVALAIGCTAVAGALPALAATRGPLAGLRAGARAGDGFSRGASFWVVAEMAISVALVATALAMASGGVVARAGAGELPLDRIATAQLTVTAPDAEIEAHRERALEAVRALPEVAAAGAGTSLPLLGAGTARVELEPVAGEPPRPPSRAPVVEVSAGYLEALAEQASAGRLFASTDFGAGAAPVAIVNRAFVERELGGRAPRGRRGRVWRGEEEPAWREIVGMAPDLGLGAGDPELAAGVYLPLEGSAFSYLAVRSRGTASALVQPIRRALYAADPALSVSRVQPLERVADEDRSALALFAAILSGVGAVALVLSLLGIYAAVSFRVARRTREIGVRVALGATAAQVVRLVVGGAARLFALGAVTGSLLSWALLSVRAAVLVARFPDPGLWLFPAVMLLLGAAGLAACWKPIERALAIEPSSALRAE
jgi:putative ABC transport system permease protein